METKCREPQAMQKWRLNGRNVLKNIDSARLNAIFTFIHFLLSHNNRNESHICSLNPYSLV